MALQLHFLCGAFVLLVLLAQYLALEHVDAMHILDALPYNRVELSQLREFALVVSS